MCTITPGSNHDFVNTVNVKRSHSINDVSGLESRDAEEDFSQYVLLLEGEGQLPEKTLNNICAEMDRLIKEGEKKQPKNLISLLHKSVNFNGVREFDSTEVTSLHSQEPPNCWSLPVHVDKFLDSNAKLESIRNAAYKVWEELRQYRKWQGIDLQSSSLKGKSHKETLQNLSSVAEKKVKDFTAQIRDFVMQNPLNWSLYGDKASKLPDRTIEVAGIYAEQCVALAKELGLPSINLWSKMQETNGWQKKFLSDGLHLTPEGNAGTSQDS
ncbi:SGNH hydrolase-type esterase superfamily protein [Perilla frutescens var. hirtella]|nr:SGNH hydrolase-type esterase superfamily protein [Perilla frutescens var. hirtella]